MNNDIDDIEKFDIDEELFETLDNISNNINNDDDDDSYHLNINQIIPNN